MNSKALLSVLIPTKNRQRYAASAVTSILRNPDPRLEVIVQDNSDEPLLKNMLSHFSSDSRLRYFYVPDKMSGIENFCKVISNATGEYICLIGDDDGVNPEIVEATAWAKEQGIDALVGSLTANYRWAGTEAPDTLFTRMTDSTLTVSHFTGRMKQVDIEYSLVQFARAGATYYLEFCLPKVYHGIIRADLLEKLKSTNGAYIRGLSPDIYLSISLCSLVKKLVMVDYPLTLPGVCPGSGSVVEGQIKKHSRKLEDAPHFRGMTGYTWSKEVPPIYCVEALWCDSALHALHDSGRDDLLQEFDRHRMYINIISANTDTYDLCIKHMYDNLAGARLVHWIALTCAFIAGPVVRFLRRRALSRMLIILRVKRLKEIRPAHDIVVATDALLAYIKNISHHISLPPFVKSGK